MNNNFNKINSQSGVSLIELLVALGGSIFVVMAIVGLLMSSMRLYKLANNRSEAVNLASQSMEISFMLKNKDWEKFYSLADGEYHIASTANSWEYVAGPTQDGLYTKKLNIEHVYRDNSATITDVGTVDPDMVKIRSIVSWNQSGNSENIELVSYISR